MSSRAWQRIHGGLVIFWIVLTVVAYALGWMDQTRFVSVLSLVALILASAAAWQASRAEVKIDQGGKGDQ